MNESEIQRIDRITKTVHDLLNGRITEPLGLNGEEKDEIRQLSDYINNLVLDFSMQLPVRNM